MSLGSMLGGYRGIFVGLLLAGLAVILLGSARDMPFLTAIGGALFGTSLGSLVSRLANQGFEERVRSLVQEGVTDSFVSDEEKLLSARVEWHLYHVTEMGGEVVWRHTIVDFTKSSTPGRLTSTAYFVDESGQKQPYNVEAGRRDERFVLFLRPPMSEEAAVTYIFPYMGFSAFSLHHGITFLETWDGTRAITPAILSRKAIHDHKKKPSGEPFGTLPDETARSFDRQWRRDMNRLCSMFPEAGATTKRASLG